MNFIVVIKGVLCTGGGGGGKVSIFRKSNLSKITRFLRGYGRIKQIVLHQFH